MPLTEAVVKLNLAFTVYAPIQVQLPISQLKEPIKSGKQKEKKKEYLYNVTEKSDKEIQQISQVWFGL